MAWSESKTLPRVTTKGEHCDEEAGPGTVAGCSPSLHFNGDPDLKDIWLGQSRPAMKSMHLAASRRSGKSGDLNMQVHNRAPKVLITDPLLWEVTTVTVALESKPERQITLHFICFPSLNQR